MTSRSTFPAPAVPRQAPDTRQPHFLCCLAAMLGAAALLILIGRYTELDLTLANRYYDAVAATFPAVNAAEIPALPHFA